MSTRLGYFDGVDCQPNLNEDKTIITVTYMFSIKVLVQDDREAQNERTNTCRAHWCLQVVFTPSTIITFHCVSSAVTITTLQTRKFIHCSFGSANCQSMHLQHSNNERSLKHQQDRLSKWLIGQLFKNVSKIMFCSCLEHHVDERVN